MTETSLFRGLVIFCFSLSILLVYLQYSSCISSTNDNNFDKGPNNSGVLSGSSYHSQSQIADMPAENTHVGSCSAFLLIITTVPDKSVREAIRAGWLRDMEFARDFFGYKHKFVMGHQGNGTHHIIKDEMELHNDIILLPFQDTYWNLSVKVQLALKSPEVLNQCKYIVKVDCDVHINAKKFIRLIRNLPSSPLIYGGHNWDIKERPMVVSRDPTWKFSFTREEFPAESFNSYMGGPLYFLSDKLATLLPYTVIQQKYGNGELEAFPSTYMPPRPAIFRLEDAYLGNMIGTMGPDVLFFHVPNIITDWNSENSTRTIAVHGIKDPDTLARGYSIYG
jgi:Galactosyltransferase